MRITQKIGALAAVPLCAVAGLGALALTESAATAGRADQLRTLISVASSAGDLTRALQDERTEAAEYLAAPGTTNTQDFEHLVAASQASETRFRVEAAKMSGSAATKDLLRQIDAELANLPRLRQRITSSDAPPLSSVVFTYHTLVGHLLSLNETAAETGQASESVVAELRASGQLAYAAEYTGEEQAAVLRAAIDPKLAESQQQDITAARSQYTHALETFDSLASPKWRLRVRQVLGEQVVDDAQRSEDAIIRTKIGDQLQIPPGWTDGMAERLSRLEQVQAEIADSALRDAKSIRSRQLVLASLEVAAVAGTILIAVVLSLRLGRPIIRGLRQLRDGARSVAYEQLPAAVDALHAPGALLDTSPEQFAEENAGIISVSGDDEITEVAKAFHAVHREAVRTAAEQVLLRAGVGATFVALARRGERLSGALTVELDKAEQDEHDPDRLARLFTLDHLAARMSRNNESLLVLGGEGSVRVRDHAMPLVDVLRASLGRIERYTRVSLGTVDERVLIVPQAVDHLVHMCAELLDNATAFSPPQTLVTVDAHRLADRVVVQISDEGIGIRPGLRDELNARLAAPTAVDVDAVRAMGLTVVSHLAARYGVHVELRPRGDGQGTIAELVLPGTLYRRQAAARDAGSDAVARAASAAASVLGARTVAEVEPAVDLSATPTTFIAAPGLASALAPAEEAPAAHFDPLMSAAAAAGIGTQPVLEVSPTHDETMRAAAPIADASDQTATPFAETPDQTATPIAETPDLTATPIADASDQTATSAAATPAAKAVEAVEPPQTTTLHGLPKRVPMSRLPAEIRAKSTAGPEPEPDPDQAPEPAIDSTGLSATMAAFARGMSGSKAENRPDKPKRPNPPRRTQGSK